MIRGYTRGLLQAVPLERSISTAETGIQTVDARTDSSLVVVHSSMARQE